MIRGGESGEKTTTTIDSSAIVVAVPSETMGGTRAAIDNGVAVQVDVIRETATGATIGIVGVKSAALICRD
jgi:hypothetical protein